MGIKRKWLIISHLSILRCAHKRNRTFTPLREPDFESGASTNSAIWAFKRSAMLHAEIKSAKHYWQHFFFGKKKFLNHFAIAFNVFILNCKFRAYKLQGFVVIFINR